MNKFKLTITCDDQQEAEPQIMFSHEIADEASARAIIRELCKPARKPRKGKTATPPQAELPIRAGGAK